MKERERESVEMREIEKERESVEGNDDEMKGSRKG